MAQRPIWRGHLRLALVSCPVALYSANHDRGSLRFNLLNPATGNRVKMVTEDAETGDVLSRGDLVKGYEYKKGSYVVVEDEDFESARVESSTTIKIDKFVPTDSIDPVYFDASYYLAPDGEAGEDVYVVLRDAIAASGKAALSRAVIARREHPIAIMPMGQGLVAHTLHEARDLNDSTELFEHLPKTPGDRDMIQLATQLIDRQAGKYDPADAEDRYESRLRAVIDAKLKGEGVEPEPEEEPDRGNVVDLMAALKKSLGQAPASAPAPKKAAKAAAKPKPAAKAAEPEPKAKPKAASARAVRKRA